MYFSSACTNFSVETCKTWVTSKAGACGRPSVHDARAVSSTSSQACPPVDGKASPTRMSTFAKRRAHRSKLSALVGLVFQTMRDLHIVRVVFLKPLRNEFGAPVEL
ncbi:hypothetical protein OG21DRAFT_1507301, partial [Imleria badia]